MITFASNNFNKPVRLSAQGLAKNITGSSGSGVYKYKCH
jgi:hypothetical protein